ncbi:MAG TPA: phage holin family protein [Jatrophihabitantaceae bacterium]|jgi:putative membrane protein
MLKRLVIRLVVLAVLIGIVAAVVPGIHFHGGFIWLFWVALIFAVVNLVLGPLFTLLSLPFIVLTLGLFLLVINAALLAITAGLSKHLDIDSFGAALLGGFLIAVLSWLSQLVLPLRRSDKSRRGGRRSSADTR